MFRLVFSARRRTVQDIMQLDAAGMDGWIVFLVLVFFGVEGGFVGIIENIIKK